MTRTTRAWPGRRRTWNPVNIRLPSPKGDGVDITVLHEEAKRHEVWKLRRTRKNMTAGVRPNPCPQCGCCDAPERNTTANNAAAARTCGKTDGRVWTQPLPSRINLWKIRRLRNNPELEADNTTKSTKQTSTREPTDSKWNFPRSSESSGWTTKS